MITSRLRPDKILLVGMMGTGKSTVGAALATRLGCPYLDNDSLLERTAGMTAPELVAADGEQALQLAESRVLTVLLALPGPETCRIMATGKPSIPFGPVGHTQRASGLVPLPPRIALAARRATDGQCTANSERETAYARLLAKNCPLRMNTHRDMMQIADRDSLRTSHEQAEGYGLRVSISELLVAGRREE